MNIQKDKNINKSFKMRYYYGVTCCLYIVSVYSTIVINEPQPRGVHIIILSIGK